MSDHFDRPLLRAFEANERAAEETRRKADVTKRLDALEAAVAALEDRQVVGPDDVVIVTPRHRTITRDGVTVEVDEELDERFLVEVLTGNFGHRWIIMRGADVAVAPRPWSPVAPDATIGG